MNTHQLEELGIKSPSAGARIGSALIDLLSMQMILGILALPFSFAMMPFSGGYDPDEGYDLRWGVYGMLSLYTIILNKDIFASRSIGKRATNQIVVRRKDLGPAGALRCMVRNLTIIIWPIEGLILLGSPTRRLGDMIAGTMVISYQEGDVKSAGKVYQIVPALIIGASIFTLPTWYFFDEMLYQGQIYEVASKNEDLGYEVAKAIMQDHPVFGDQIDVEYYERMKADTMAFIKVKSFGTGISSIEYSDRQKEQLLSYRTIVGVTGNPNVIIRFSTHYLGGGFSGLKFDPRKHGILETRPNDQGNGNDTPTLQEDNTVEPPTSE